MTVAASRVVLGAAGHPGVGEALAKLSAVWFDITSGEGREAEWESMALTSARKAVSVVGVRQVDRDPCLLGGNIEFSVPAPGHSGQLLENAGNPCAPSPDNCVPRTQWSVREVIGTAPFDPPFDLDQTLAEAVLQRTWPILRYAVDADTSLRRGPELWEPRGDLTRWAVSQLADLIRARMSRPH